MSIGADVATWIAGQPALKGIDVKASGVARKLRGSELASVGVQTTQDSSLLVFGGRSTITEATVGITVVYNRTGAILNLRASIHEVMNQTLHGYKGQLSTNRRVLSAQQVSFTEEVSDNEDILFDQYDFEILYQHT